MKAGVTGTQHGWTEAQRVQFTLMVSEMDIIEWHHGDCVGVDEQASLVVRRRFGQGVIHSHPPDNPKKRAWVPSGMIHIEKPYLDRNDDIVDAIETLFAIPQGYKNVVRSGTWYTYREAIKQSRQVILILPSGEVE